MICNIVPIHETIWSLTCITSRKYSQLVSAVTDQMHDVDKGFDQIQVLQAQGHEMFSKDDGVEAEIRSKETKDLFDRAEAILLAMNATVNCTNNTNASGCNGTNTTDAGVDSEVEVVAAERAIHAEALSLRKQKFELSKMLYLESSIFLFFVLYCSLIENRRADS